MTKLKGLYHRRVFIQGRLQIDPESYEWGLSARSVDLKWNPQQRMMIGELNRLCSALSSVSLFLEMNITQKEASVMFFEFVILISQFLENNLFSFEWIHACNFVPSKGLEKQWLLEFHQNEFWHPLLCTFNLILVFSGWLEPLLDRIAANWSTVVCPVIDVIDDSTLQYNHGSAKATSIGGFDWNLQFNWHGIPQREVKRRGSDVAPIRYALGSLRLSHFKDKENT